MEISVKETMQHEKQQPVVSPPSPSNATNTTATMFTDTVIGAGSCEAAASDELSYFVVVAAVRVRGLPAALRESPLAAELLFEDAVHVIDPLLPLPAPDPDAAEPGQAPSSVPVLGREHMHLVMPIRGSWRSGVFPREAPERCLLDGGDAACVARGGVHVLLRDATDATQLGSTSCYYPGDWFTINPCGGEVQVMFTVCCQKDNPFRRSSTSGSMYLNGQTEYVSSIPQYDADVAERMSVATDDCTGGYHNITHAVANIRQVHSASATPRYRLPCTRKKAQPKEHVLNSHHNEKKASLSADCLYSKQLSTTAAAAAVSAGALHHRSPHVALGGKGASGDRRASTEGDRCGSNALRTRECQPRSLVFSHIQVSGFHPISSYGSWRLEFTWPQHQVSPMKRVVRIPTNVDANGSASLQETLSIDLPLFIRGEVQTYIHAVWSGSGDNDTKTRLYMQVEFDPIVAVVLDHEMQQEELRCRVPMLSKDVRLTVADLTVQLLVRLEFFEPQRDGRNGRPTSAFPRFRGERTSSATTANTNSSTTICDSDDDETGRGIPDLSLPPTTAGGLEMMHPSVDRATHTATTPTAAVPPSSAKMSENNKNNSTNSNVNNTTTNTNIKGQPLSDEGGSNKGGNMLHRSPPPQHPGHAVDRYGMYSLTPQRPGAASTTQSLPDIRDLVPCYSEQQRQEVFQAYDTENRGHIAVEQLLHFCRAHVALFDGEDNDANILRGLRPCVPFAASRFHNSTHTSSPLRIHRRPSSSFPDGRLLTKTAQHGHDVSSMHRDSMTTTRPDCASLRASTSTLLGLLGCESDGITYDVFEIIALRLASM